MRISDLFGGPQDEDARKQAQTIAETIAKEMQKEEAVVVDTVSRLIKKGADQSKATEVAIQNFAKKLTETVEKIAPSAKPGEKVMTREEVAEAFRNVGDSVDEQNQLMKKALKNETVREDLLEGIFKTMETGLVKAIDKQTMQSLRLYKEGQEAARADARIRRREEQEGKVRRNAGGKKDGDMDKLLDLLALKSLDPTSIIAGIGRGIEKMALGLGVAGLAAMLPQQARDMLSSVAGAFTTIKALFSTNLLAPLFKILGEIPILGPLAKKIPLIAGIMFFFENALDIAKEFTDKGALSGTKLTLARLYDFFVKDLVSIVGVGLDKLETLFGADYVDWAALATKTNAAIKKSIGELTDKFADPKFWFGDWIKDGKRSDNQKMPGDVLLDQLNEWLLDSGMDGRYAKWKDDLNRDLNKYFTDMPARAREQAGKDWDSANKAVMEFTSWFNATVNKKLGDAKLGAMSDFGAMTAAFDATEKWFKDTFASDEFKSALDAELSDFVGASWGKTTAWFGEQWEAGIKALGSKDASIKSLMDHIWESMTKWAQDMWDSLFTKEFWLGKSSAPGAVNLFRDAVEGLAPEASDGPKPNRFLTNGPDKRQEMVSNLQAQIRALDMQVDRLSQRNSSTKIDNSTRSNQTTYSVSGSVRAGKNDPLSSSGGSAGSGW